MKDMEKKKKDQVLSNHRTGEQFWYDLVKKPSNEDNIGQSFVIIKGTPLHKTEKPIQKSN